MPKVKKKSVAQKAREARVRSQLRNQEAERVRVAGEGQSEEKLKKEKV